MCVLLRVKLTLHLLDNCWHLFCVLLLQDELSGQVRQFVLMLGWAHSQSLVLPELVLVAVVVHLHRPFLRVVKGWQSFLSLVKVFRRNLVLDIVDTAISV
jgi:hypothetical protein